MAAVAEGSIFYPDLGDLSTPEPGQAEGLTIKPYEHIRKPRGETKEDGVKQTSAERPEN